LTIRGKETIGKGSTGIDVDCELHKVDLLIIFLI
jgi:hypothetical protein